MSTAKGTPHVLRTAVVWGTTVLAIRDLKRGQSLAIGDMPIAVCPKPDGSLVADWPIRAVPSGFEVDARGATGGVLHIRGRTEEAARVGQYGALSIAIGDYGLVQYGSLGIFFQFTSAPPNLTARRRTDWPAVLAFLFALVTVGGALFLLVTFTTPRALAKPIELATSREFAVRFFLDDLPVAAPRSEADPLARSAERAGLLETTDTPDSDVSEAIRRTFGSIPSIPDALGGLNPEHVVLTRGQRTEVPADSGAGRGPDRNDRNGGRIDVATVVDSRKKAFLSCYEAARLKDPKLAGAVTASWSITPSGTVENARIESSSLASPGAEQCILRHLEQLRFRPSDRASDASFSFTFPAADQ